MIAIPSRTELINTLLDIAQALDPSLLPTQDSDLGVRIQILVDALQGIYYEAGNVQNDIFPSTASTDGLEMHAATRLGTNPRLVARGSVGIDAIRVYGETDAEVVAGDTLTHDDGTRYQLTEGGTIPEDPGYIDLDIESISTGSATNKEDGETLSFETPPAGIETEAILQNTLAGGCDEETDAELLARVLHAIQTPPAGGRFSDYWAWAMEVGGVDSAYVYGPSSVAPDGRRGLGTVDVAILAEGTASARIPSTSLQTLVRDNIDAKRPCPADAGVLIPVKNEQEIDITIEVHHAYDWDWRGSQTNQSELVDTWTAGTLTLKWQGTRPTDLAVNDRIFLNGQILTVKSLASATETVLDVAPDIEPQHDDPIYPAGPCSAAILQGLKDYIDSLGPARGLGADPDQVWDDELRLSKIFDVVMDIEGVKDCVIDTPAANIVPTDDAPDGTVELIVYGETYAKHITIKPEDI